MIKDQSMRRMRKASVSENASNSCSWSWSLCVFRGLSLSWSHSGSWCTWLSWSRSFKYWSRR
jgi:hypothetical protein